MENFIKIPSVQGVFDTSGNKNLCDFQIPANSGSYDLSQSFINVNCKIDAQSTDAVTDDADAPDPVYNMGLVINESARETNAFETLINPANAVLVKNARMVSAKGKLEDIRRVDCLKSNLAVYSQDDENVNRNSYGLSNGAFQDSMPKQPLNALVGEGDQLSEQRNHDIRIPLSAIFNLGKTEVYDTSNYGHTKINLELNLDKLSAINKTTAALANADVLGVAANGNYTAIKDITNGAAADDGIGSANHALVTTATYQSIEDSPFYVGQRCDLGAPNGSGDNTGTPYVVQIASIEMANNTTKQPNDAGGTTNHSGSLVITLTKAAGYGVLQNGENFTGITLTPKDPTSAPITVNNIELVAKMSSEKESEPTQYLTYSVQEDSAPAGDSISRTYHLPENTTNVYIMFNNPIYSHEALDTYRLTLDGVDVTNRDVKVGSALHYDLISQVYMNKGAVAGSVLERMYDANKNNDAAGASQSIVIIMCPVKLKNSPTQLGVELNGTALSGKIIVYSEVVKEM